MSDTATDIFDQHPVWGDLESVEEWLDALSKSYSPGYIGLPELANDFLRRIDIVTDVLRVYLESAPKESVSKELLDELRGSLTVMAVNLQQIDWDNETDYDSTLSDANEAADRILTSLFKLGVRPVNLLQTKVDADTNERARVREFINKCSGMINDIQNSTTDLETRIANNKSASEEDLEELRQQIAEVAESFEEQIDDGVEAGKQRIDDQIKTLQNQYNSEIEKQKITAKSELDSILSEVHKQKNDLDEMVENTQRVSGYMAEHALSRMFKERAEEAKSLWTVYTICGGLVSVVSAVLLLYAGHAALGTNLSSADIVRSVVRALIGVGVGAFAAYLLRQASIQQKSFQDSRSAEARLGSLDAFLAQFDEVEAMEIRRGVGQRVYIDGELGEAPRTQHASVNQETLSNNIAANSGTVEPDQTKADSY